MGKIQDILSKMKENKSEFKEQLKQAQINDKINNTIEERKKSSNQRELERVMNDNNEARIKIALDKIHKKQNKDNWKSNSILKQDTNILKNDRPILKEKNIFMDNRNKVPLQNKRQGMFFRW